MSEKTKHEWHFYYDPEDTYATVRVFERENVVLANLPFSERWRDEKTIEAAKEKARLIAAAPDLYMACREAERFIEMNTSASDTLHGRRLLDHLQGAISKAEGEAGSE